MNKLILIGLTFVLVLALAACAAPTSTGVPAGSNQTTAMAKPSRPKVIRANFDGLGGDIPSIDPGVAQDSASIARL